MTNIYTNKSKSQILRSKKENLVENLIKNMTAEMLQTYAHQLLKKATKKLLTSMTMNIQDSDNKITIPQAVPEVKKITKNKNTTNYISIEAFNIYRKECEHRIFKLEKKAEYNENEIYKLENREIDSGFRISTLENFMKRIQIVKPNTKVKNFKVEKFEPKNIKPHEVVACVFEKIEKPKIIVKVKKVIVKKHKKTKKEKREDELSSDSDFDDATIEDITDNLSEDETRIEKLNIIVKDEKISKLERKFRNEDIRSAIKKVKDAEWDNIEQYKKTYCPINRR